MDPINLEELRRQIILQCFQSSLSLLFNQTAPTIPTSLVDQTCTLRTDHLLRFDHQFISHQLPTIPTILPIPAIPPIFPALPVIQDHQSIVQTTARTPISQHPQPQDQQLTEPLQPISVLPCRPIRLAASTQIDPLFPTSSKPTA